MQAPVLQRIRDGKFVELSSLVPRAAIAPMDGFQMVVNMHDEAGLPTVNVVPKAYKSTIKSFHEWLSAFMIYAQAYLHFFQSLPSEVLAYVRLLH